MDSEQAHVRLLAVTVALDLMQVAPYKHSYVWPHLCRLYTLEMVATSLHSYVGNRGTAVTPLLELQEPRKSY